MYRSDTNSKIGFDIGDKGTMERAKLFDLHLFSSVFMNTTFINNFDGNLAARISPV